MADLGLFATRTPANQGTEIELLDVNDQPSGHSLTILGTDSDAFQKAQFESKQKIIQAMKDNRDVSFEEATDTARELVASLVSGWTFKDEAGEPLPCTKENVVAFLTEAPQVQAQIDAAAADKKNFTKGNSENSAKQ